ncbi:MAG TPA: hypothetical protein VM778_07775, partial [Gemmatimonadota bacterium]|nr:hypothetical protein [Gemmatimonadota bacterium]
SKDAFNAFLKTLEEPPRNVVFVLATTEAHKILPTILSRCQRFDFRPIPLPAIRERLRGISEKEGFELDEGAEFAIARKADGSLRDALSLLDQVVAFGGDAIDLETLRRLIGIPDEERYLELTGLLAAGDPAGALAFTRRLREAGYDLEEFYAGFLEHLRNCLLFALDAADGAVEVPERWREAYRETAGRLGAEDLLRMLTLATDEEGVFRRSSQQGLVLEVLLVRLALLDRTVDVERALAALAGSPPPSGGAPGDRAAPRGRSPAGRENPRGRSPAGGEAPRGSKATGPGVRATGPGVRATGGPESALAEPPGELSLELLAGEWEWVLGAVHAARPTVAAALGEARPAGFSAERVTLTLPPSAEFRREQLSRRGELDCLAVVLRERWSFAGAIEVRMAESPAAAAPDEAAGPAAEAAPAPVAAPARAPTAGEIRARDVAARIEDDPVLKQVVELFDANVVRVRRSSPARP